METKNKLTAAKLALWKGLETLGLKKPIYQISIKELCQISHVARSTFYVYYQNIDELVEEMEDFHVGKLLEINEEVTYVSAESETYQFYMDMLTYVQEHQEIFYAWLVAYPNNRFMNKWKSATRTNLLKRIGTTHRIPNQDLIIEMIASGVIAAYTYWLQNPYEIDVHAMDEVASSALKLIK